MTVTIKGFKGPMMIQVGPHRTAGLGDRSQRCAATRWASGSTTTASGSASPTGSTASPSTSLRRADRASGPGARRASDQRDRARRPPIGRVRHRRRCWWSAAAAVLAHPRPARPVRLGSGVAQGSLIAAIALGVVLTYRGSGVVNFANGTVAMYVGVHLHRACAPTASCSCRRCPNPLALVEGVVHWFPGADAFRPARTPDVDLARRPHGLLAGARHLARRSACCSASLFHVLIFRPLRTAPPLAKVVASVGLLLLLQAIVIRRFATTRRAVKPCRSLEGPRRPRACSMLTHRATVRRRARHRLHGRPRGALPVHPLRPRHARRRREREGRGGARLLARPPRRHQLGAVDVHHRAARHPRGVDQPASSTRSPFRLLIVAGAVGARWSAGSRSFGSRRRRVPARHARCRSSVPRRRPTGSRTRGPALPGVSQLAAVPADRRRALLSAATPCRPAARSRAGGSRRRRPRARGRCAAAGRRSPCSPRRPGCSGSARRSGGALAITRWSASSSACRSSSSPGTSDRSRSPRCRSPGISAFALVEARRPSTAWPVPVVPILARRGRRRCWPGSAPRRDAGAARARGQPGDGDARVRGHDETFIFRNPVVNGGLTRAPRRAPGGSTRTGRRRRRCSASPSATARSPTRWFGDVLPRSRWSCSRYGRQHPPLGTGRRMLAVRVQRAGRGRGRGQRRRHQDARVRAGGVHRRHRRRARRVPLGGVEPALLRRHRSRSWCSRSPTSVGSRASAAR